MQSLRRGAESFVVAPRLTGTLFTFAQHALYVGPLLTAASHRHHAGQILWAPDGVDIAEERKPLQRVTTHVVAPHRSHRHGEAAMAAVLWVDRDDVRWDESTDRARDLRGLCVEDALEPGGAATIAAALLTWVASQDRAREPRHPAVRRMVRTLDASVDQQTTRVTDLGATSGLSARQLRHRFTEELGIHPSGYLRWRRLRAAIDAIERGATLTEGAIAAGFADGAHFSRVFQAHFGMPPSHALSSLRVQVAAHPRRSAASG